jgi:hypothetical protein
MQVHRVIFRILVKPALDGKFDGEPARESERQPPNRHARTGSNLNSLRLNEINP